MIEKPTYEELEKKIQELEKKENEQISKKLHANKDLFSKIFYNSPMGMAIITMSDGKCVEVNDAFSAILGYDRKQSIGRTSLEIGFWIKKEDRKRVTHILQTNNSVKAMEIEFRHCSGELRIGRISLETIKYKGEECIVTTIDDITKQKQIDNMLIKERDKAQQYFDVAEVMMLYLDRNQNVIQINKKGCEILEYTKDEIIGRNWFDNFLPKKNTAKIINLYEKLMSGEKRGIEYYEKSILTKNGNEKIIAWHDAIIKDKAGNVKGILTSGADITQRRKAEKALLESEELFRNIFEQAGAGICQASVVDGHFLRVNKQLCSILGYPEKELLELSWREITHPDDLNADIEYFQQLIEKKLESYSMEKRFLHKNGSIVWINITAVLVKKSTDEPIYTIGIIEDITERKQNEDALQESEEKYRVMMESMKNATYICSSELKIEYMNPAMTNRVGTDAIDKLCYKIIYDRDAKCPWCVFDQIIKGETVDYEVANPKDNHYYSVSNSPIFHAGGKVSKLTIFHDITEMKNIEAQLQQSRKMESIGTLTGGIAHDFNNLLYMISGNTELALEDIPDWNPAHQNLQEIKTASLKAAGIVKQLLHFSRKTDQKLKPIGAVTVIKDSLKFLRSTIPSTIEIKKQLPDAEIPILADPIQINQIMMNLCINASHAMEETGGTLEINIETAGLDKETVNNYPDLTIADNYLKITLSDTGPGIPSKIINRIFDPYFTTKEFGKGSGMGLTVVQGIIKNHDGTITVDSQVGKGTAFTILFPVIDEAPEIINKTTDAIPHGTENILFVDDEKSITNMMQQVLEKFGYHVKTSLNPVEALDLFQSKPDSFDIVITDMTMPQMTGAKMAEKLKEIRSDIPIILCTGHSSLIDEDKAQQSGISGYVMKPVSMSKIAEEIRKVLDR
ncbi:MAG: PAS domain S-box protein [Desulfobacteraceae bacterium]|nr:PAS domain S-box protein [Desulfobacteraceae bacterium]